MLLHTAAIIASPELADAAGYDMGGEGRDESPAPDGIPDFVQFKLLQALLEDAGFDATPFGGMSNNQVSAAWEKNVTRARKDMPEAPAGIQNAIAAYMTFATDPYMALAKELALKVTGVTLNSDHYMQRDLALEAEADLDGDGLWNRLEWRHIAGASGDAAANLVHADAFVKSALDRKAPDRKTVDIGIDLADGDGKDWNYDHLPHCTITFRQEEGLPIDARILDPPGREDVPLPVDTPVSVPLGAEIIVTLGPAADADWFYTWEAPGHMIDGSGEKTERFRTMRDGFVHPVRRPVLPFQLPESQGAYRWEWHGVGPVGHLVSAGESEGGDRFAVPLGAFLQVAAYRSAPEGNKEYAMTWRGTFANAETFQVYGARLPLFVAAVASLEPDFDAPRPDDYLTHCLFSEGGGAVVVGGGMLTVTGDPRLYLTHWERLITARPAPDDETKYPLPRSVIPWPGYQAKM